MAYLCAVPNTELTEYTLSLLQKHGIKTVREFLDTDVFKLVKIVNLSETTLSAIKKDLLARHGPKVVNLLEFYSGSFKIQSKIYHTGIEGLDNIMMEYPFGTSSVWEVCGQPAVGKTQMCLTMAVNFASSHEGSVLYIDTKSDFSGVRVREILRARDVDKGACCHIMQRILVEEAFSPKRVIDILEQLQIAITTKNQLGGDIKVVFIDSLPAVWFLFHGETDSCQGKVLLTKLTNLMYKLANQHFVAFLIVNLAVTIKELLGETEICNANDEDDSICIKDEKSSEQLTTNDGRMTPALGRFWNSVPQVRLLIELVEKNPKRSCSRLVKVIKSCYSRSGDSCLVTVSDLGIV